MNPVFLISFKLLEKWEYSRPIPRELHFYNRPFRYYSTNAKTHHKDLCSILQSRADNLSTLVICSDNGVDVTPHSWIVLYYMGMLFKELKIDNLFVCSNAPYCSRYNEIERFFGDLTKRLAQVILVPQSSKYFKEHGDKRKESEIKEFFSLALKELEHLSEDFNINENKVNITNIFP